MPDEDRHREKYALLAILVLASILFVYDQLSPPKVIDSGITLQEPIQEDLYLDTGDDPAETNETIPSNETEEPPTNETSPEANESSLEANETVRYPEANETEEPIQTLQPPSEPPRDVEVTFFFFHADYCTTCQTMIPFIRELGREHPSLHLELIDLHSNSPYIKRFAVTTTAISVIMREEDGVPVSGTKIGGFMDKGQIEKFICTEFDDEKCDSL